MTSPRSGFRRTAIASWALAGIGMAGVAGTSALAYAGTLKPAEAPAAVQSDSALPAAVPLTGPTAEVAVRSPQPVTQAPAPAPAPAAPIPAYTPPPAPAPQYQQAPQYTPPPVYAAPAPAPAYVAPAPAYVAPAPAYVAPAAPAYVAPAPVQQAPAPAPSGGGFTVRQSHTPLGGGSLSGSGNKFAPSHTASRGS